MFILSLIGIVITALIIYWLIEEINKETYKNEKYRFFTTEHTIGFVTSYIIMLVGFLAMKDNWLNDWINGAVIMLVGIGILVLIIHNNFTHTSRSLAIQGSIVQVILYIPIAIAGIVVLFIAYAIFSQTKPVYNINSKD